MIINEIMMCIKWYLQNFGIPQASQMSLFEDTFQNDTPERKKNLNKIRLYFLYILIFLITFTKKPIKPRTKNK